MKVQLEKTFPMPASADTAWGLLQDIEGVATCMPGAAITARTDATHYKGTVAVKLGPASLSFRGDIEVVAIDPAAKSVQLIGKGQDSTGASAATMNLTARVEAVDAGACNLIGNSEVSMSGKVAAFGSRMMVPVSEQVLKQFAANFANKVQAMQAAAMTAAAAPATTPASGAAAPASATATPASAAASGETPSLPPQPAAPAGGGTVAGAAPINGFAFVWAIFKDWLRSRFGGARR